MKTVKMRFTKAQLVVVCMAAIFTFSPPANAYIMQVVIMIQNFITTTVNGFNAVMKQESAGGQAQANAEKQSAEVIGATIAEHTKQLGNLQYSLNFKGSGTANTVASIGCMWLEEKDDKNNPDRHHEELAEDTAENVAKALKEYGRADNDINLEEDTENRMNVLTELEESDFPRSGIFPNGNITEEQRELWQKYVMYLTVPGPINLENQLLGAKAEDVARDAFRFREYAGALQKVLLSYGDKYTAAEEGGKSRMDTFTWYKAVALSPKRAEALNKKPQAAAEREAALVQSMILDVEGEISESQRNITGLMTVLSIEAANKVAKDL